MAEVLLDSVSIISNATIQLKTSRITKSSISIQGIASSSVKTIKSVKWQSEIVAGASIPQVNVYLTKYTRAYPTGRANASLEGYKFKTVKAQISAIASTEMYIYDFDVRESMLSYLPSFYREIKDIHSLIVSEANEFTRLYALLDELSNQFFVDTATYALDDWLLATNAQLRLSGITSYDDKRNAISKRINGLGTITPSVLKSVVDDFFWSEIKELPEPGVVQFKILGQRGEPDNIKDVEKAVNEVIPAHLEPSFEYSYLPWEEVEEAELTWEQAESFTYEELEEAFLIEPPFPHK